MFFEILPVFEVKKFQNVALDIVDIWPVASTVNIDTNLLCMINWAPLRQDCTVDRKILLINFAVKIVYIKESSTNVILSGYRDAC